MTRAAHHLPDPETQAEFYQDVSSKRLVAFLIDCLLTLIVSLLIVPFTAFTGLFFFPLLFLLVGFVYRVVFLTRGAATPGMRFVAIELRGSDGAPVDRSTAILHTFGFTLCMGLPILQVLSVVLMLMTPRGQGLPDQVLGTVMVNRRARY